MGDDRMISVKRLASYLWQWTPCLAALLLGVCCSGADSCTPVRKVNIYASEGAVAANLYGFQLCLPSNGTTSCTTFNIKKVVINFANRSTHNPVTPIATCPALLTNAIEDAFCWNKTDQTIRVTSLMGQFHSLTGSQFLYTIQVQTAIGSQNCYLHLRVDALRTTALTNATTDVTKPISTTSRPSIDVKILPGNKAEMAFQLGDGNEKAELRCSSFLNASDLRRVNFRWFKDGLPLERLSGKLSYNISKSTSMDANGITHVQLLLAVDLNSTIIQGYYRCAALIDSHRMVMGNQTLIWLRDVASMRLVIKSNPSSQDKLENRTAISVDEFQSIFSISLGKELKRKGLKKNKFDIFVKNSQMNKTKNQSLAVFDVFYRDADDLEKLRLCKMISKYDFSRFNLTSLDCCFASTTGTTSLRGEIKWKTVLHATQAQEKCPFSRKASSLNAYRLCMANFVNGPFWGAPKIKDCPKASETTKKLKKLSETKINKANKKAAMKELRHLTRDKKNLTNELDFEFSTEIMENVLNVPDDQNEVLADILGTTSDLMNCNKSLIFSAQQISNTSTRLLALLEKLSDEVQVNSSMYEQQENLAIAINVMSDEEMKSGLKIQGFMNGTSKMPQLSSSNVVSAERDMMAYAFLSPATLRKINEAWNVRRKKVTSFLFNKPVLFESSDENGTFVSQKKLINGKILSLTVNGRRVQDLSEAEEIENYFKPSSSKKIQRMSCVYWNFKAKGGKGDWSTKGCRKVGMKKGMFLCKCNHMTNFAILLDVSTRPLSASETKVLSFVSYIGCSISLLSLVITITTFASFRKLRQSRPNKILLCLSTSLLMTMVIFLGGSLSSRFPKACEIIAVLLHYFVLSTFCWMVVEAYNIYRSFIVVFQKESLKFMLRANIFAWGVPFAVVLITTVLSELKDYSRSGTNSWICIVGGLPFYIAYLSPISVILLGNLIVLIITMLSLGRPSSYATSTRLSKKSKTKIAIIFSILLGCTWIFGLVAIEGLKFTFQLLFCIFNSLQGFFIFIFFCLRNEDVRDEWKRLLCGCSCRRKEDKFSGRKFEPDSKNQTMQLDSWKSESHKSLTH